MKPRLSPRVLVKDVLTLAELSVKRPTVLPLTGAGLTAYILRARPPRCRKA